MSAAPGPEADLPTEAAVAGAVPADWDAWMSAWEEYLAACMALPSSPDADAPQLPEVAVPLGAVPAGLSVRLLRAQALKDAAVAQVAARLGQVRSARRVTTMPGDRPVGRVLADL